MNYECTFPYLLTHFQINDKNVSNCVFSKYLFRVFNGNKMMSF